MKTFYHGTPWSNIERIAMSQALLSPAKVLEAKTKAFDTLKPKEREAEILRRILAVYDSVREDEYKDLKGSKYIRAIKKRAESNGNDPYHRVTNVCVTQRLYQAQNYTGETGVVFALGLNPKTVNGIYVPKRIPLERLIGILIYNGTDVDRMRAIELFGEYTNEIRGV